MKARHSRSKCLDAVTLVPFCSPRENAWRDILCPSIQSCNKRNAAWLAGKCAAYVGIRCYIQLSYGNEPSSKGIWEEDAGRS